MAKNDIDPEAVQAALKRLRELRASHIRKMANSKTAMGAWPRTFLDVQEAIEKLEKLAPRPKGLGTSTQGPKPFSS